MGLLGRLAPEWRVLSVQLQRGRLLQPTMPAQVAIAMLKALMTHLADMAQVLALGLISC